uniref:Uncharacterized protein n=1 Tax=Arundo donax TaxID=35708 RepID=A0A0A9GLK3_ARUDO
MAPEASPHPPPPPAPPRTRRPPEAPPLVGSSPLRPRRLAPPPRRLLHRAPSLVRLAPPAAPPCDVASSSDPSGFRVWGSQFPGDFARWPAERRELEETRRSTHIGGGTRKLMW